MKKTLSEMKIQNIVGGSNIRLDVAEEKVSELKDIATEIILNKILKKKRLEKNRTRVSCETILNCLTCM